MDREGRLAADSHWRVKLFSSAVKPALTSGIWVGVEGAESTASQACMLLSQQLCLLLQECRCWFFTFLSAMDRADLVNYTLRAPWELSVSVFSTQDHCWDVSNLETILSHLTGQTEMAIHLPQSTRWLVTGSQPLGRSPASQSPWATWELSRRCITQIDTRIGACPLKPSGTLPVTMAFGPLMSQVRLCRGEPSRGDKRLWGGQEGVWQGGLCFA